MAKRWKNRPEGSNWGEFGNDNQLGRLNLITREKLLQWIAESGLAAIITDNHAVEALPARVPDGGHGESCAALPLHAHCLFKLGIHLGELRYLSELARRLRHGGRYRFLLTAPPLRLPHAVGSPVTPVTTV